MFSAIYCNFDYLLKFRFSKLIKTISILQGSNNKTYTVQHMERKDANRNLINEIATVGLQAATRKLGAPASRRQIRKGISQNIGLIDKLLRLALIKSHNPKNKMKRNIEIGAVGALAFYNFYKGFKRKKKLLVYEGVFLTCALAGVVWAANSRISGNKIHSKDH